MKKEKKENNQKKPRKKLEFSKFILSSCMFLYFITVTFGIFYYTLLHKDEAMDLTGLFTFVGAPTGIAIGFYVWKAKCENIHKNPQGKNTTGFPKINSEEVLEDGYNSMPSDCSGLDSCDMPSDIYDSEFDQGIPEEHTEVNDGNTDYSSDSDDIASSVSRSGVSHTKSETEMRRMVKVRRIRSGKTTRRGYRSA